MNKELIQHLALEAGFSGPSNESIHWDDPEQNFITVRSEYDIGIEITRFAALVAEECARIADSTPMPYARDFEPCDAAEAIRKEFKLE